MGKGKNPNFEKSITFTKLNAYLWKPWIQIFFKIIFLCKTIFNFKIFHFPKKKRQNKPRFIKKKTLKMLQIPALFNFLSVLSKFPLDSRHRDFLNNSPLKLLHRKQLKNLSSRHRKRSEIGINFPLHQMCECFFILLGKHDWWLIERAKRRLSSGDLVKIFSDFTLTDFQSVCFAPKRLTFLDLFFFSLSDKDK